MICAFSPHATRIPLSHRVIPDVREENSKASRRKVRRSWRAESNRRPADYEATPGPRNSDKIRDFAARSGHHYALGGHDPHPGRTQLPRMSSAGKSPRLGKAFARQIFGSARRPRRAR